MLGTITSLKNIIWGEWNLIMTSELLTLKLLILKDHLKTTKYINNALKTLKEMIRLIQHSYKKCWDVCK